MRSLGGQQKMSDSAPDIEGDGLVVLIEKLRLAEAARAVAEAERAAAVVEARSADAARAAADAARAAAEAARATAEAARAAAVDEARMSDAARAAAEVARAAAEERAATAQAVSGGVQAGAAVAATHVAGTEMIRDPLRMAATDLLSPTNASARNFLEDPFCEFATAPVSLVAPAALREAFTRLLATASTTGHGTSRSIMAEEPLYGLVTGVLPAGSEHRQELSSAGSLFGRAALLTRVWAFASACKPELKVRSAVPRVPGFGGELKSAASNIALEQAAYYTAMDMVRSYFPAGSDNTLRRTFYTSPPLGFAVVGYPYLAHLISLEWIGKLVVAPFSQPFVVGSDEHRAAVAALPTAPCAEPVRLNDDLEWRTPIEGPQRGRVCWTVDGPFFRKLLRGDARSAAGFASMFRVYDRLSELLRTDATRPPALVPHVRLLFGANEVMVEMTAVEGDDCTTTDVTTEGPVLTAVARAIAWLACNCVVYTDVRGPNVRRRGDAVFLIDFDDCFVADAPLTTVAAYAAALEAAHAACNGGSSFAAQLCCGALPHVMSALTDAFSTPRW